MICGIHLQINPSAYSMPLNLAVYSPLTFGLPWTRLGNARMRFGIALAAPSVHRHQKTSETVVCLRGRLVWEYYDELGRCTETIELRTNGPVVVLNVPIGQWHTVHFLESGSVILEVKDGAYEPLGEEVMK